MRIKEIFGSENLLIQTEASGKEELIRKMAELAARTPEIEETDLNAETLYEAVIQREEQFSTAIGEGLLFPHARFCELHHRSVILIATLKKPLECDTPDGVPVRIACMVLIPEDQPMQGLKFIASFAKKLKDSARGNALASAPDPEKALEILNKMNLSQTESLTASDVMGPFRFNVTPEMRLKAATRMMVKFGTEAVPVMDGRKLVGQLSSRDLFLHGIPENYSPGEFCGEPDPLEKYFSMEASSHVADVMNRNISAFQPETPLIDIVFELSVRNRSQVYIVNKQEELLGVIDQNVILERIHNL